MPPNNKWKKYIGLAGILFLFPLLWVMFFGVFSSHHFKTLPYYGPGPDTSAHRTYVLPPFAFVNQDEEVITLDSLRGKVWLAAFYSLNDPNAARITERLLNVNWKYRDEEDILIICFSTDCEFDQPRVLRPYIDRNTRYNGFRGKWQFLTGSSDSVMSYIRNAFAIEDIQDEEIFRLVDTDGHIRGKYGNTEYHITDAIEDIALLKKEIDRKLYNEKHAQ